METSAGVGQPRTAQYDRALQETVSHFSDAFNRMDANELASFWAEDGTLINPAGHYGEGRDGVARIFREDAAGILAGTTSTFRVVNERKITDSCSFVELDHEVRNFRAPDGSTRSMRFHVVMVARKQGGRWQVLDARPYAFLEAPPSIH